MTDSAYTNDTRRLLGDAIENCLFTFNSMAHVWNPKQNIDAARSSILSEIEHFLHLTPEDEDEDEDQGPCMCPICVEQRSQPTYG